MNAPDATATLLALLLAAPLAATASPAPTAADSAQGPHHRTLTAEPATRDATGASPGVIQLEPGLNRWVDGHWIETSEQVEARGNHVVARGTQHKVIWSSNARTPGAIDIELPDGARLRGHCLGLGYYDASTGRSALVAELQDSTAEVHAPNLVLYRNAFDDLDADLLYVNRRASLEQYVVLHAAPPPPADFDMDPATTRLEVISEFVDAPRPRKQARTLRREPDASRRIRQAEPDLIDETLDFGAMFMGPGHAFLASGDATRSEAAGAIPVAKRWEVIEGRNILFESVEYPTLRPFLATLGAGNPRGVARRATQPGRTVPALTAASRASRPVQLATTGARLHGVVLDYSLYTTWTPNFVFQGDRTYYVSGAVTLSGSNTTFEAGAVIKFAPTNSARLDIASTNLTWLGTAYRPVILTARDDASVGETIAGSALSGSYATVALGLQPPLVAPNLAHLRIAHSQTAIAVSPGTRPSISHAQLVNCGTGLRMSGTEAWVRNALMASVATNFDLTSATAHAEHLTAAQGSLLHTGGTLFLTNSILAGIATNHAWSGTPNSVIPTATGAFSSSAAGSHYLPPNSPHRDAGTGLITPNLLRELRSLTTTAPTSLSAPITLPTALRPQAPRDVDAPDLGYHYPPIDLVASNVAVEAEIVLAAGVAIGLAGSSGFDLEAGASLVSEGTPRTPNRLVGLSLVQEQPSGSLQPKGISIASGTALPAIGLAFTDLSIKAGAAGVLVDTTAGTFRELSLRDCTWRCGSYAAVPGASIPVVLGLTNNILDRVSLTLMHASKSQNADYRVRLLNNLLRNSNLALTYMQGSTNPVWCLQDNLFDGTGQVATGDGLATCLTADHNGFTIGTTNGLGGSWNRMALARDFLAGPLGDFYYPTNGSGLSQLRNAGSRPDAAQAGLYHHTTTFDLVKEANSIVDIGFHYVATDAAGTPLDWDGDMSPDYLEDRNGNNVLDAGETSWTESSHGLLGPAELQVFTPLK